MAFEVTLSSQRPDKRAVELLSTLLYTALAEADEHPTITKSVMLLTFKVDSQRVEIGVISHVKPFFDGFESVTKELLSGRDGPLAARVEAANTAVHRTDVSIHPGTLVPHEMSLAANTFSLHPVRHRIIMPNCSTSELLIALSAVIDGHLLNIEHNGPGGYRDRLLLEYLDRAQLGQPVSFDDFECKDHDPESWFMSRKRPLE